MLLRLHRKQLLPLAFAAGFVKDKVLLGRSYHLALIVHNVS